MNNEPVAYINKDDGLVCAKCFNPLYTHPAKTLTDEEIIEVWNAFERTENIPIVDFAKALRKAQEK